MVQGVGFRYFAYYASRNFDLTGWVKNHCDGTVHLEIQGEERNILDYIDKIKQGNGFSEVDNITMEKIDVIKNEVVFRIIG